MPDTSCAECGTPIVHTSYGWCHLNQTKGIHSATPFAIKASTLSDYVRQRIQRALGRCDHPVSALLHTTEPDRVGWICSNCNRFFQDLFGESITDFDDSDTEYLTQRMRQP